MTVQADEALINTENGTTSQTISEMQLRELPLVNRSVLDLAVTLPNVSGDSGSEDPAVTSGQPVPGYNLSLNGGRPGGTSILNNRRRILRRGLPYGALGAPDDDGEHGVIFLAYCSDLFRQFEFIQQQWLQYGLDVNAGNDTCPLLGNRDNNDAKFVIASDPASGKPPFVCSNLPQFVELHGGNYFFVPSMTALRMIGMGTVDPT